MFSRSSRVVKQPTERISLRLLAHCSKQVAALYRRLHSYLFKECVEVLLIMLKAKLHRATVTKADLDYEGSIGIDADVLDVSGILPNEQVDVLNISTGGRFTTYAIEAPRGSREIAVNGAAARLVQTGDKVIVIAYCQVPAEQARNYKPVNRPARRGQRDRWRLLARDL
jgi:aspartate 1-decarboxylase